MLLARHPEGLTGDELLCALYEDESVTPVTLRAELARLRRHPRSRICWVRGPTG